MGAKMILLDLDKTILDINMQITDLRIIEEIARLQADGWRIGLNSDRHFNSVMHFQRILQTNGPIIAEKGNIVRLSPNVSSSGYLVDARRDHFESLYMRFVNSLRRNDSHFWGHHGLAKNPEATQRRSSQTSCYCKW